jgi:MFS family permease
VTEAHVGSGSGKKFVGIEIPPDLKWSNFFNMYVGTLLAACLLIFPAVVQPALLKEVIKIPDAQAGTINAGLQNIHYIATLLFIGMIGILSDRVGRRILAIVGFVVCGVSFILFGYTKDMSLILGITSVGGQVFVAYVLRLLVAMGLILCYPQFITLVADYTYERDRGKGMAWNGIMMGVGSIIVFGVLAQVARKTGLLSLFYMAGAMGFLGAIISRLWLKDRMPKEKPKTLSVREIYKVVAKSLALKASYVTTLVVRADMSITGTFLIVWMVYAAEKFDISPVKATAKGGIVMMVVGLLSFVAFPVVGVLLDRIGRVPVIIGGLIIGGVGFCLAGMAENPFSAGMYFFIALVSIGTAASVTGANTLCADASPKPLLGGILGGLNTMYPIGVLFFLQAGGFLFDKVGYGAPFVLKGVANLACGLWILAVRARVVVPKMEKVHT